MINKKNILQFITAITIIVILFILSQTILFTWSPVKIGYKRFNFKKYNVYIKDHSLDEIYANLDGMLLQSEKDHNLLIKKKLDIVICDNKVIRFYIPWLKTSTAAGVWPNTVYLSTGSIETFKNPVLGIMHEVSHLLLLQNYGERTCTTIWKNHEWLPEGYAVYITQGYPKYRSKSEVKNLIKENINNYAVESKDLFSLEVLRNIPMTVKYSLYNYYITYLIETYGEESLLEFLNKAFKEPELFLESFSLIFKISFPYSVINFNKYILE